MKDKTGITGYRYADAGLSTAHGVLLPAVLRILAALPLEGDSRRLFELGCGNGSVANELSRLDWDLTGMDTLMEGIRQARAACPDLKLFEGSAYDDLAGCYGRFPVLLSLEVVEHVYAPSDYACTVFELLEPGGIAIISTP